MRRTKNYAPPMIIKKSRVYTDTAILTGSVVNQATVSTVEATEQQVVNHDFSNDSFNHNWE